MLKGSMSKGRPVKIVAYKLSGLQLETGTDNWSVPMITDITKTERLRLRIGAEPNSEHAPQSKLERWLRRLGRATILQLDPENTNVSSGYFGGAVEVPGDYTRRGRHVLDIVGVGTIPEFSEEQLIHVTAHDVLTHRLLPVEQRSLWLAFGSIYTMSPAEQQAIGISR
jgi:hypothetical protein